MKMQRTIEGYRLTFEWHGGEYIDVCWPSGDSFDVIHVDYENTPFTQGNMKLMVDEYNPSAYELGEYYIATVRM